MKKDGKKDKAGYRAKELGMLFFTALRMESFSDKVTFEQ